MNREYNCRASTKILSGCKNRQGITFCRTLYVITTITYMVNELTKMESSLTTQRYIAVFPLVVRAVITPRPLCVTRRGVYRITTEICDSWCVLVSKSLYAVSIPQTADERIWDSRYKNVFQSAVMRLHVVCLSNRPTGRPRTTWMSQIVLDTGLTAADAWATADDRSTWRALRPTAGYA